MKIEHYVLCLDTDHYAGNFERETTAYATGLDCIRGQEEAAKFHEANIPLHIVDELEDKVIELSDGDEYLCRCQAMPTPGWSNNGMGKHTRLTGNKKMEWPAYMSIGINLAEPLSDEALKLLIARAREYFVEGVGYSKAKINLESVRLITKYTDEKEEILNVQPDNIFQKQYIN